MPRGGFRPGSGRPSKNAETVTAKESREVIADGIASCEDPAAFLADLMNNTDQDMRVRADAAKALLPYVHAKKGEAGKKAAKKDAAATVAGKGKFAPGSGPRLVVNNGK